MFLDGLRKFISKYRYDNIRLHHAILHVSEIMEKSQIAISSNGRSVYELAEMNIPSIIVSHHEREHTHDFAGLEKGFVNLGVIGSNTSIDIRDVFIRLTNDRDYRLQLYMNIEKYSFRNNKKNIMNKIYKLLDRQTSGELHEVG